MKLLLIGGFLGAGKTTLITNLLPEILKNGTAALIENEYGEISIDNILLQSHAIKITAVSGGCICCQLIGNLIGALAEIEETINPDWCIIELSGMAVTSNVLAAIRQYYRKDIDILTIVVCDASRWNKLQKIAGPKLNAQLDGADLLVFSKTDLSDSRPKIETALPVIDSANLSYEALLHILSDKSPIQTCHIYPESAGKAISRQFSFHGIFTDSDIKSTMQEIIQPIAEELSVDGTIPGHIKALAAFQNGFISASMTSPEHIDYKVSKKNSETVTGYNLTVIALLSD